LLQPKTRSSDLVIVASKFSAAEVSKPPAVLNFAAQAQMAFGRFDEAAATLVDIDAMIQAGQRWGEAKRAVSKVI
jgi:hypothetical protein